MTEGPGAELDRLRRRLDRERRAREAAESIAERVTADLYATVTELQRVNDELGNVNQSMREFVAVAAHDLRGPLTSIMGFTELILKRWAGITEDQKLEFLGTIGSQGRRLGRLVDDLLTISQIEAGAMEVDAETLALATELERTVADLGEVAAHVRVNVPGDLYVVADPDHLNRILTNYIGNAGKYGAPPIEAEAGCDGAWVDIRVRDQGEGVPEEFVARLFGKFARASTESTKTQPGTGLGLSIVRGLARANGGDAWYEPNQPRGSCFGVRLPRPA